MADIGSLVNEIYPMAVRADRKDSKGQDVPGVISDYHHPDYKDDAISRGEADALSKLKAADVQYREQNLPQLVLWARNSPYYGKFLKYDPAKEVVYMVSRNEGTDLEGAVMYSIPEAQFRTSDGRNIPIGILGSPIEYEKKIREMSRMTGKGEDIVARYALDHEYMHILSTQTLLGQDTLTVEGTTDFMLLNYYSDMEQELAQLEAAASSSETRYIRHERMKYAALREIAEGRVLSMELSGYRPPMQAIERNYAPLATKN